METVKQVMAELKKKGSDQTRKIYQNHGANSDQMYGVKVADLKVIATKIRGNHALAMELYDTGNSDAMYLAGMVADPTQMTKKQLDDWAKKAPWYFISEYAVPGVAHASPYARDLSRKWIKSRNENVAACGWSTYAGILATVDDDELAMDEVRELLKLIEDKIETVPNRVKYTMNGFVIAVGGYVKPLAKQAQATAKRIGKVECEMGKTACKVPLATEYIAKMQDSGRAYKKRKTIQC